MLSGMFPNLTRAAGLAHLAETLPRLGVEYARRRNHAPAPGEAPTSSLLSPWLRHRLLTEQEVVMAATLAHGEPASEAFVHEIFWRTYFKGYLEQHPDIWLRYRQGVTEGRERLARVPGLARVHAQAISGTTGLDCLDAWSNALRAGNWLHNHERMWFASIWTFTLGLPWELGAAFFEAHLIDADPASNVLGWRWVAGLHTVGKPYVARAENIERYTGGRFNPRNQLDEAPEPLVEAERPARVALSPGGAWPELPFALLLHLDDAAPEPLLPASVRVARLGILRPVAINPAVRAAQDQALRDLAQRMEAAHDRPCDIVDGEAQLRDWADGLPLAAPAAPIGEVRQVLDAARVVQVRRPWDTAYWPHCTRGFFQLRGRLRGQSAMQAPA